MMWGLSPNYVSNNVGQHAQGKALSGKSHANPI